MKRIAFIWLVGTVLAGMSGMPAVAQSDSLGDYARQTRKQKTEKPSAAKQFDNDSLPKDDKLSIVGQAPADADATSDGDTPADPSVPADAQAAAPKDQADAPKTEATSGQAEKDRQQIYQEWQKKIAAQKEAVDLSARELDVAQREYRLRAAAFYADAGNRLRSGGSWDKEDTQYKQQIASKQKAVDDAKQKLDDLQEEARKAGVPSGMRE